MSKQRAKGTRFETELLATLRRIWPKAKRAGTTLGPNDQGDYLNTGDWIVEAKNQKSLLIPAWVRAVEEKADGMCPWMLCCRTNRNHLPDLAVLRLDTAITLLEAVKEKLRDEG